jgi:hypothetical protein
VSNPSLSLLIHEEQVTRTEIEAKLETALSDEEWFYLANHISDGIEQVGTFRAKSFDYLHRALYWHRSQ